MLGMTNITNMDITSYHNMTRMSIKAGAGGLSYINYDEKT